VADIRDGSASGLLMFLDQQVRTSSIDVSTGRAYRSTVRRVFGPSAGDLDRIRVCEVDLDDAWRRFTSSDKASSVRGTSLPSYRARLRRSVSMYCNWLQHDPDVVEGGDVLVEYPFPVRAGVRATLRLPARLTAGEAARLAAFVTTLALGDTEQDGD
jgi:hypothetical protein